MADHSTATQEEYLSKEQFCKECHISKATALYLIESKLVPAINTQRQTNRYLIARSDMLWYLRERELNPARYRYEKSGGRELVKEYTPNRAARLRKIILQEWADVPDVLRLEEVSALLGYTKKEVRAWRKGLGLKSLIVSHTLYFPKKYLIEFVASPEFHSLYPKSPEHMALLRRVNYA